LRALAHFALRRVRLLTVLALFVGLWLILHYDPTWHSALVALAAVAAAGGLGLAARFLFMRRARGEN
jgi:hypothetical protein